MTEWFADDAFWEAMYPYMFPAERFEAAEEQVERLLDLADIQGDAVLDLACGPGRHAVVLAGKGYRVTGVDRSPFLLGKAKTRATAAGVEIEWVLEDMRAYVRPEAFDLALSMFTSFGYFDDKSDDVKVLGNIYHSLRQGGAFLIDVMGKEQLASRFVDTSSTEESDGTVLIERREIYDDWSRIRNEWILLQKGKVRSFNFRHTIYSGQELKDRLAGVGFDKIKLYGDLGGSEYGPEAERLVAVAWK